MVKQQTQKSVFSKLMAVFMCITFLFSFMPKTFAAIANDSVDIGYSVNGLIINKGDSTEFNLSIQAGSDVDLSTLELKSADDSSFKGTNFALSSDRTTATVTFQYSGKDSFFKINAIYQLKNKSSRNITIIKTVSEANVDGSTGDIVESDDKTPILNFYGEVPQLDATTNKNTLDISMKNVSLYSARNISITLAATSDIGITFDTGSILNSFIVGSLTSGNSASISIPLSVTSTVKDGYVDLPIKITFYNIWDKKFEVAQTVRVKVKNPAAAEVSAPNMNITDIKFDTNNPSGKNIVKMSVTYKNDGKGIATKTVTNLTLPDTILVQGTGTKVVENVKPGESKTVVFDLYIPASTTAGNHQVTANVVSTYDKDKTITTSYTTLYSLIREISNSSIAIANARLDKNRPGTDNLVSLSVDINNPSSKEITDISLQLDGLSAEAFTLFKNFDPKKITSLKSGETKTVTFNLYVSKNLTTGNHPLSVKASFKDNLGAKQEATSAIYLYIDRPEVVTPNPNDTASTPRVIISNYTISTDLVEAGKPFDINFTLENTSATVGLKNMKVTVVSPITEGGGGVFLPVQGTNSFFVKNIPAGGTKSMAITLAPKTDAETKSYPIEIRVEYEDEKSKPFSVTESITLPVNQPQRLEIGDVNFYPFAVNMASNVNFSYANKGRSSLYNLSVKVEGPFKLESGNVFIGNFAASSSEFFDDMLIPTEAGELSGKIIFEFEDINGNIKSVSKEFNASVPAEAPIDPGKPDIEPMPELEEEKGGINWWYVGIGGGVVILVAIAVLYRLRKKKKEKEWMLDEKV